MNDRKLRASTSKILHNLVENPQGIIPDSLNPQLQADYYKMIEEKKLSVREDRKKIRDTPLSYLHAMLKSNIMLVERFNISQYSISSYLEHNYKISSKNLKKMTQDQAEKKFGIQYDRIKKQYVVWIDPKVPLPKENELISFINKNYGYTRFSNWTLRKIHAQLDKLTISEKSDLRHYLKIYYKDISYADLQETYDLEELLQSRHKPEEMGDWLPREVAVWILPDQKLTVDFLNNSFVTSRQEGIKQENINDAACVINNGVNKKQRSAEGDSISSMNLVIPETVSSNISRQDLLELFPELDMLSSLPDEENDQNKKRKLFEFHNPEPLDKENEFDYSPPSPLFSFR